MQAEFLSVTKWFHLSEYHSWEDYKFEDLIATCKEIDKSLFTRFDQVRFDCSKSIDWVFKGDTFRHFIDIVLIIFNNAIAHSGFQEDLKDLRITCSLDEDTDYLYMAIENNLADWIDLEKLDKTIERVNNDFANKAYLVLNTRQEGGMGLYNSLYISDNILLACK